MSKTFLNDIDTNKIDSLLEETKNNVNYFQDLTIKVVKSYTEDLDVIMNNIYKEIIQIDQAPLFTLEKYFLELSNCLYFMVDKLEQLGIYDVMSKNAYKEVYNNAYLNMTDIGESKKKPTVAELTANAEKEAQYESVVSDVYAKAYKIVKNKMDAAATMLNSLSKIISKRMGEMQLNSITPTGRQILNENIDNVNSTEKGYVIPPSSYCNVF